MLTLFALHFETLVTHVHLARLAVEFEEDGAVAVRPRITHRKAADFAGGAQITHHESRRGGKGVGNIVEAVAQIVSLALNMFFLGAGVVVLGRMMADGHRPGGLFMRRMHSDFPGPGMMLRALPAETRARIEKEIGPDRAAMRAAIAASRQARREAGSSMVQSSK